MRSYQKLNPPSQGHTSMSWPLLQSKIEFAYIKGAFTNIFKHLNDRALMGGVGGPTYERLYLHCCPTCKIGKWPYLHLPILNVARLLIELYATRNIEINLKVWKLCARFKYQEWCIMRKNIERHNKRGFTPTSSYPKMNIDFQVPEKGRWSSPPPQLQLTLTIVSATNHFLFFFSKWGKLVYTSMWRGLQLFIV